MNEREKFEMWWDDRPQFTQINKHVYWDTWQAALSAAPTPPEVEGYEGCAATGMHCNHGAYGPNGSIQCQYCGESPEVEPTRHVGYLGHFGELFSVDDLKRLPLDCQEGYGSLPKLYTSPPSPKAEGDVRLMLDNLLAYIHRDGGHYRNTHGTEKAVKDAIQIIANRNAEESATYDAEGNPLNLMAAAEDVIRCSDARDSVGLRLALKNLRKFIGEGS